MVATVKSFVVGQKVRVQALLNTSRMYPAEVVSIGRTKVELRYTLQNGRERTKKFDPSFLQLEAGTPSMDKSGGGGGPSLRELLTGKGAAVEKAVAEKAASREAALKLEHARDRTAAGGKRLTKSEEAELLAAELATTSAKPARAEKKAAKAKVAKVSGKATAPKLTVAGFIRSLVDQGKTNEEIWKLAQPKFKMPEAHRHYPGWYRAEMMRKKIAARRAGKKAAK